LLLGLTTALLPLGTAGIVATILPVNDAATARDNTSGQAVDIATA
jgi:hypothetical protein